MNATDIYLFKFNNGNTRTICKFCSQLTIMITRTTLLTSSLSLTLKRIHTLFWYLCCDYEQVSSDWEDFAQSLYIFLKHCKGTRKENWEKHKTFRPNKKHIWTTLLSQLKILSKGLGSDGVISINSGISVKFSPNLTLPVTIKDEETENVFRFLFSHFFVVPLKALWKC